MADLTIIFFLYGLAFFSMGGIIVLEGGRGSDPRLRHALRPLAAFGLIHGAHEWLEMFQVLGLLPWQDSLSLLWEAIRLASLTFSFASLAAFGASLLSPNERRRRVSLVVPLGLTSLWAFGILAFRGNYEFGRGLWDVADVWTRYSIGIPSALIASAGLIAQQRAFRMAGMAQFGRDSLWAAVSFAWYGLVGQLFTRSSLLPPSTFLNEELFLSIFGFPIQALRAASALAAAIFVIRFLRAFEVETQAKITDLQNAQLQEAQEREALRGELLKQVVGAQEAERQRVGRELHDEIGQALTAVGLGLRGVSTMIIKDEFQAIKNLRQLEGLVDHSLIDLRRLIADLRPSHLDDLGLSAALRWYVKQTMERSGLEINFSVNDNEHELSSAVKTTLFRIVQEGLINVIKHAQASMVEVELRYDPETVFLRIYDDGRGFKLQPTVQSERPSWGLLGMRERTSLLNGSFDLRTAPGEGTEIYVTIPYQKAEDPELMETADDH